ncbi:MAG: CCA tRNA nucleotidyltransferase [Candidatus Micrarchaeota archaeon]
MPLPSALRKKILERISPTPSEAAAEKRFALSLSEKLGRAFAARGSRVKIHFVGSTARDTGLRGDKDIDLFVSFPRSLKKEEIVAKTIAVTKKTIRAKWEMHYAEHPYLQAVVDGFEVEVIPCFATKPHEKLKSAVDRSPLHMLYLQEKLSNSQREDVRLMKQLLKAHGIYGAEARVGGFSGLLCEYLVLNYRSLENLMKNAAGWKPQIVIDMENYYEESKQPFTEPLVLVDAIDRNRNAAAPVTETALHKFILLAREYKAKPNEALFFPKKRVYSKAEFLKAMKKRGTDFLLLEFRAPRVVDDILWPQLARTAHSLRKQLEQRDWSVAGTTHFADEKTRKGFILIELESLERPRLARVYGPPVTHENDVRTFLAAHKKPLRGPFVEGARVAVEEKRALVDAQAFLKTALKQPIKIGVASYLRSPLRKARYWKNEKAVNAAGARGALEGIAEYLF